MSQSFERCPAMNLPVAVFFTTLIALAATQNGGYYGKYLGPLSQYHHGVSGEVYVVDARTLHIRDFTYDGEGPAAYFYVGNTKAPGPGGLRIRDETGSSGVLKKYNKKHLTLTLPEGKTLSQMKWFSVWCDEFSVNFGHINIPRGLEYPKPQKIGALNGVHSVTSDSIVVVDAQTLLIPSFSYDGEAPDAKFWVGRGNKPTPQGIRVPDENGKVTPLRKYERKTIVLTLPGDLTIYDIDYFGIWCEAFTVDFGHVKIPQGLLVPPSLRMLGVSPQKRSLELSAALDSNGIYLGLRPGLTEQVQPTTFRPFQRFTQPTVNRQVQQYVQQQPILEQQQRQSVQYSNPNFQQLQYQPLQAYQQQYYQPQAQDMVLTLQPPPAYQPQLLYDSRTLDQPQQYQQPQLNQIVYQPNLQNLQEEPSVQILPSITVHESQYQQRPYDYLNNQNIRPTNIGYQPQQIQQPIYYQTQPTNYQPYYQPQPTNYQPYNQPNNYIDRRSYNAHNPYINH